METKKKLTAKQYLRQLHELDAMINQDFERLEEMKARAVSTGFTGNDERVQDSMNGDKLSLAVTNYVAFEEKIDNEIDRFVDLKEQIILEIRSLHKVDYVQVLFKLYVQYKSLSQVADDLGWTYACAANTHSKALRLFEDIHPNLYYLC